MIYCGDLFHVLPTLESVSVDACITDPPYGIGLMGKKWDTFKPSVSQAMRARTVKNHKTSRHPNLKGRRQWAGGAAVEYDNSRRGLCEFQRWTEAWAREVVEDAGLEIRDCLSWLYGQEFPKSLNLGDGRGTALKPSWEPIVLARKPIALGVADNVAVYGTGALNIEACRLDGRRWPADVLLDDVAAAQLNDRGPDVGGASRFYYVAKPSRRERDVGCEGLPPISGGEACERAEKSAGLNSPRAGAGRTGAGRNFHPTVKPINLMRWLVRLITPPRGVVLDPFMGSGTTGMACVYELRQFIGIERESAYVEIARRRIAAVTPLFSTEA